MGTFAKSFFTIHTNSSRHKRNLETQSKLGVLNV